MNNKNWNDRADKDLFFTILGVKNIGVISGSEWVTIGNSMRLMGYGFTNEGCRQHFQGLRRAQNKLDQNGSEGESPRKVDPTLNPITRRPGPGRGRPRKSTGEGDIPQSAGTLSDGQNSLQPLVAGIAQAGQETKPPVPQQPTPQQQHHPYYQPPPQQPHPQSHQHLHQQPQQLHQPPSQQAPQQPHQQSPQQSHQSPHQQPSPFERPQAASTPQFPAAEQQQSPPRYPSPPAPAHQSISPQQTQIDHTLTSQGQQSEEAQAQSNEQSATAPVSATENGSVPPPEPLRLESEDGEGEVDHGPEGPPVKRQKMEHDDDLGQDQSLDDDPVLALASANNGAGASDYHSEFDYAEA